MRPCYILESREPRRSIEKRKSDCTGLSDVKVQLCIGLGKYFGALDTDGKGSYLMLYARGFHFCAFEALLMLVAGPWVGHVETLLISLSQRKLED